MSNRWCLENRQGSVSRQGSRWTRLTPSETSAGHGLRPQRAPKQCPAIMVSGGCCEGLFPDTVCWTRLRNTWTSTLRSEIITQLIPRKLSEKILVSVKFLSAILGPDMAAPILWAPRISAFFLQENLHVRKNLRIRGGGKCFFLGGGGEVPILFLWARGFF